MDQDHVLTLPCILVYSEMKRSRVESEWRDELQMANGTNLVYQGLSRTGELYRPAILPNSIFPHSAMRNTTIHTQPPETRHTKRIDYGTSLGFHREASPPKEKWRWITDGIFEKMGWVLRSRIQDPVEIKPGRDWWFEKVGIHGWEGVMRPWRCLCSKINFKLKRPAFLRDFVR